LKQYNIFTYQIGSVQYISFLVKGIGKEKIIMK